ncbi:hypothetical protein EYY61_20675 [Pantoea agglomerans]|jgi:hypothetical protein|nr:hypothetical protein D0A61_19180 [Pantoea agglomerans]MVT82838.1 hypothetical protein [Pantoea agglomerans]HAS99453.1 hypothetical protein [Pantoea agglomerans]
MRQSVRLHSGDQTQTNFAFWPGAAQINSGAIHAVFSSGKAQPRLLAGRMRMGIFQALTSVSIKQQ